jgi:glycosyltransferase involved in cell wall biosynthesis
MKINIFLLCYNEELMLPHTLNFYKTNFPNATIHIVDNYSTDSSCDIAEKNGCQIIKYDSNEQQDERLLIGIRSHIWKKYVTSGWVIMCDMDEWLNITDADLEDEDNKGKTIITTNGVNMVGESNTIDFSDINLFEITKGAYDERFSKKICFKYPDVNMEYWWGAHTATAHGNVVYTDKPYLMKHYNYLGEQYLIEKYRKRYERNQKSREMGMNGHYLNDIEQIKNVYKDWLSRAIIID